MIHSPMLTTSFILALFVSVASGKRIGSDATVFVNVEDDAFWDRILQDELNLSTVTPSPTPSLTMSPTASPDCNVEVNVECVDADGVKCDELVPEIVICEKGPEELVMLFNGGECSQSFNIQPSTLFQCFDLIPPEGAGPPPLEGNVYIQAQASKGSDLYFDGEVQVGEEFALRPSADGKNKLAADTSILIRENNATGRPMQLINFHSSCSRNLFLKDKYGATQVVEWTNEVQGTVDCKKQVSYNYTITNTGNLIAELVSLTTLVDPPGETQDLSAELPRAIVEPGESFFVPMPVTLDLTTPTRYVIQAELVGRTIGSRKLCNDTDALEFVAGGNGMLPPDAKPPPTSSPTPTADRTGQKCVLEATAECVLENNASCSLLTPIPAENVTCVLPNGPTELGWIYRGTNCDGSRSDVSCMDLNGGPNANSLVNVLVRNGAGEEVLKETGVTLNEHFVIPSSTDGAALDGEISVTFYIGADEDDGVLQIISGIQTDCNDEDYFILGTSYGALEFASYRDDENFVQAVQPVEWRYLVINTDSPEAFLTVVLSITNGETLMLTPNVPLDMGASFSFSVPSEISLIFAGTYTGEVSAAATSPTADDIECGTSASSIVTLA